MEKISLYDLFSLLLPGSLLSLFFVIVISDFGINLDLTELNQYYQLIMFLSSALIIGSGIDILTRSSLKFFRWIGIHPPIVKIYNKIVPGEKLEEFYLSMIGLNKDQSPSHDQIEVLWSEIYFELEATEKISAPKNFQSFYFFFRNFLTLSVIVLITILLLQIFISDMSKYWCIGGAVILTLLISYPASKKNRFQMVKRMFWTYYSINKNNPK